MSNYNVKDLLQVGKIQTMLNRIKDRIVALESAQETKPLYAVAVDGNALKFFTTTDTTTTAAYIIDFPEEIFLDSVVLVENFVWSAATYPNSTNPNLDGKTVFVFAVKGDKATNPTIKYSFVDVRKLVDIYTASDTSTTISGYRVKVNISEQANNSITLKDDGLHVDVSNKMNKVTVATEGKIAIFASDGSVIDSTFKVATDAEFTAMLDEIFPVSDE